MRRNAIILVTLMVISTQLVPARTPPWLMATRAAVDSLRTDATSQELFASFVVNGAFDDDARERLAAGLPLEFVHVIEVARRRTMWFDKMLLRKTITTTVTFDTLTRQYSLSKKVNDEVAETSVAMHEAEVEKWMTCFERVRLGDLSRIDRPRDGTLYVRVRSMLQKRFVLFFVPWDVETGWEKVTLRLPDEATTRAR